MSIGSTMRAAGRARGEDRGLRGGPAANASLRPYRCFRPGISFNLTLSRRISLAFEEFATGPVPVVSRSSLRRVLVIEHAP